MGLEVDMSSTKSSGQLFLILRRSAASSNAQRRRGSLTAGIDDSVDMEKAKRLIVSTLCPKVGYI